MVTKLSISRAGTAEKAAASLEPAPKVRQTGITSFGSVADAQGFKGGLGFISSFNTTFTNASGGTLTYVVGDGLGLIAANSAIALTQPSAASTTVASLQNSFGILPLMIAGMIISATSGATQFAQNARYGVADVDSSVLLKAIRFSEYQRPTNFNANQLAIQFDSQYRMDGNTGFLFTVPTGQTVEISWLVGAAAYR